MRSATNIPTRRLGRGGPVVGALGLGCMSMTGTYGPADPGEAIRTIHRALDLGINLLNTAAAYAWGVNEELVGRAIAGRREQVIIATKIGPQRNPDDSYGPTNGTPEFIKKSCDESLARLNVSTIDIFTQARIDRNVPIEETMGAYMELVSAGKVRFVGLSEASADTIRRAHAVYPLTSLESEYSIWTRDIESNGVLATIRELGIGLMAYSPLGRGFLTGRITQSTELAAGDRRRDFPRFQGENRIANQRIVDAIGEFARRKGVTNAQLAIAWVLARGEDIVPIPGTKQVSHLEQNVASLGIELTESDLAELDETIPAPAGTRYPTASMASVSV